MLIDEITEASEPMISLCVPRVYKFPIIRVSSTNPKTQGGKSVIRVYRDNKLLAEEWIAKRNPLAYLLTLRNSKHFMSLERQLIKHGLFISDVGITRAKV